MISKPTVLILGAGASVHFQYPLGKELIKVICRMRNSNLGNELPMDWTPEDLERFIVRLSRSGHYSIDAFLETVPEQAALGKYLIAMEMKRHEDIDKLFPPNESGWYQYLFNRLFLHNKPDDLASNRLAIITFNYDRSFEAYLHNVLMGRFDMSSEDAHEHIKTIPIVHVHGLLGDYPEVPYDAACKPDELLAISSKIQIIHEVTDQGDGFCNQSFENANKLLQDAERIVFLGFGFHPDNLRRLQFFSPENTTHREMFCTATGIGRIAMQDLHERLKPMGFERASFSGHDCNTFFENIVPLA